MQTTIKGRFFYFFSSLPFFKNAKLNKIMVKNVNIPEENNVLETLQIQAVKEKLNFSHYLTKVLIDKAKELNK